MISRFEHAGGKWEGWDANASASATMSPSPDISHYLGVSADPSGGFLPGFHRTHVAVARRGAMRDGSGEAFSVGLGMKPRL
jgi:hypothetical protein